MSASGGDQLPADLPDQDEGFGELLRYTIPGYLAGLLLGVALDGLGLQTSAIGSWLVRTLAGEGESLFEGVYALRRWFGRQSLGMAEAYGWGKLLGMTFPWWIDWGSRLAGVPVLAVQGFYIPFFYGMSDQIAANLSGLLFLRRQEGNWRGAARRYLRHPVMVSGLLLICTVPLALFLLRTAGFSPRTQVLTALETIAANLCWLPPLVGAAAEGLARRRATGE